ncbi:MAG: hypothetical protein ACR2Q3_11675 [Woeseiaceae bacterium]
MQMIQARLLLLVALLLAFGPFGVAAQEESNEEQAAEIDALEPAMSSDELAEATAEEIESTEPAVSTAVLAADVRRRENSSGVMDEIDLGRTEITGNQELPTVLYIVPWKKSDPGNLMGRPVNTLLDEVLTPIDRSEFIRQVDYYGDLYVEEEE